MFLALFPGSGARAAVREDVTVAVDTVVMEFPDREGPFIDVNNRTLVPIRFIVDAFDSDYTFARVDWDEENRVVHILLQKLGQPLNGTDRDKARNGTRGVELLGHPVERETEVELPIGSSYATVNGSRVGFDTRAQINHGRTMVPLRFVSEALGARVKWDAPNRQANIFYLTIPSINPAVKSVVEEAGDGGSINRLVSNPYQGINWNTIEHHRSGLHFHTTESDGELSPAEAIELYRQRGFTVLSITDHDDMGKPGPTWPWPHVPEGMLPLKGNELSWQQHITTYFTDYYGSKSGSVYESLSAVDSRGGLTVFAHPGRYNSPDDWEWYVPYYHQFSSLFGLEVYNMGDRFPFDRKLWDNLLNHFMPERPIYGMANDDMHLKSTLGINWNTLLLEELSVSEVRRSLEGGRFFFSYALLGTAPRIEKVEVKDGAIEVFPEYGAVHWISNGEVIHEGDRLEYKENDRIHRYVRASVSAGTGRTYTQPFGFVKESVSDGSGS